MDVQKIPLAQVPLLSATDKAYASADPRLSPFYSHAVNMEAFGEIIQQKKSNYSDIQRQALTHIFAQQYSKIYPNNPTLRGEQIAKLNEPNTFVVCTAHQPCLFGGALYVVYKIVAAIRLADDLKKKYPKYHFVPVFWMGSDDHDYEELSFANIYGKRLQWADNQGGAVGAYSNHSLSETLEALQQILGESPQAQDWMDKIGQSFDPSVVGIRPYSVCLAAFLDTLFGEKGLLVLDSLDTELKKMLLPIAHTELFSDPAENHIKETQTRLESLGFAPQAYARPINLFYLLPNQRERLVASADTPDTWEVLNTNIRFSKPELLAELEQHPERFSPNVILRPLFQEYVLPNLAYIGGGAEIAYWLERKTLFEAYQIPFPMLIRRPSVLWVDAPNQHRLNKANTQAATFLYQNYDAFVRSHLLDNPATGLSLADEKNGLESIFEQVKQKTGQIDPSLVASVSALLSATLAGVDKLEDKLVRALKKKSETTLQQLKTAYDKLFPNGGLQERYDNVLMYPADFIPQLLEHLEPLSQNFYIFTPN
jgi:bacillithiol biosynthesis cysteine-adding enzyme BshC